MRRYISIVLCLTSAWLVSGCVSNEYESALTPDNYKSVRIQEARSKVTDKTLNYTGTVAATALKNISFKIGGRMVESYVNEGDNVKEGQLLAKVDTADLSFQLSSIDAQIASTWKNIQAQKASYDFHVKEHERASSLYNAGAVSKSSLDSAELAFKNSEFAYEAALQNKNMLEAEKQRLTSMKADGSVFSDCNGVIEEVLVETSEMISPGQPAYIISRLDKHVVTYITRDDYNQVKIGQLVLLDIEGVQGKGTVRYIDTSADPQTHSYKVEVGIGGIDVPNGSIAGIDFVIGKRDGIWIPVQSIQATTIDFVYIVKDEHAKRTPVEILDIKGELVMVGGLKEGDQVIVSGMKSLVEGMRVKAI